jgi:hypothetical protein
MPTSDTIGRTVFDVAAVDAERPVEDVQRTTLAWTSLKAALTFSGSKRLSPLGRQQLGQDPGLDEVDGGVAVLLDGFLVGLAQVGLAIRSTSASTAAMSRAGSRAAPSPPSRRGG